MMCFGWGRCDNLALAAELRYHKVSDLQETSRSFLVRFRGSRSQSAGLTKLASQAGPLHRKCPRMKLSRLAILRRWVLLGLFFLPAAALGQQPRSAAPLNTAAPLNFQGRLLVAVSDADMLASAYTDDQLGPAQGADTLSIIRLDRPLGGARPATAPASNSVTGPPAAMAVSRDGRTAIVVETLGPRGAADTKLSELPVGRTIAVADLSNPDQPKVIQRITCPAQPETVSISAGGTQVAVTFGLKGDGKTIPLVLYRLAGGRLSSPITPSIPGWTYGHRLVDAEFAPQGDTLALLDFTAAELRFVHVSTDNSALMAWGNPVALGKAPYLFLARWTPDGRYVLADTINAPRGTVFSVRVAAGQDGMPHRLVSQAVTGGSPEGLAVSPDGRWVATSNLEQTAMPKLDPKQGYFGSITLMHFDSATGILSRVGDYPFEGILPETVLFDNSSRYVAATVYDHFDNRKPGGSIDFWRISGDALDPTRTELVKTDLSIPVARGVHTMVIVR